MVWDEWLTALKLLPHEAAEWKLLPSLIGELQSLAERHKKGQGEALARALSQLQLDFADELAFFEAGLESTASSQALTIACTRALADVARLQQELVAYQNLKRTNPRTIAEERKKREELSGHESRISEVIQSLRMALTEPQDVQVLDFAVAEPNFSAGPLQDIADCAEESVSASESHSLIADISASESAGHNGAIASKIATEAAMRKPVSTPEQRQNRRDFLRSVKNDSPLMDLLLTPASRAQVPTDDPSPVDEHAVPLTLHPEEHSVTRAESPSVTEANPEISESEPPMPCEDLALEHRDYNDSKCAPSYTKTVIDEDRPSRTPEDRTLPQRAAEAECAVDLAAWQCLARRPGLAYRLLRMGRQGDRPEGGLDSSLAAVVSFSPWVRADESTLANRLASEWTNVMAWFGKSTSHSQHPARLLALTASFVPALLAPSTGALDAVQTLRDFDQVLPSLATIREAIDVYAVQHIAADASALAGAQDHSKWNEQLNELRSDAARWRQEQSSASVIYAPTTNVWREWLKDKHELGDALAQLMAPVPNRHRVRDCVQTWSEERYIDRQLKRTDEELRGGGAKKRPIDARAKCALRKKVGELTDFLSRWMQFLNAEPMALAPARREKITRLRESVLAAIPQTLESLKPWLASTVQPELVSAVDEAVRGQLLVLRQLMQGQYLAPVHEPAPEELLQRDLVFCPGVNLQAHLGTIAAVDDLQLMLHAAKCPLTALEAFEKQLAAGNHEATQTLLEILESEGTDEHRLNEYRQRRQEEVDKHVLRLKKDASATDAKVQRAVCAGILNDAERAEDLAKIAEVKSIAAETSNAEPLYQMLAAVRQRIDEKIQQRIADLRRRLQSVAFSDDRADDQAQIEEVLAKEDFDTADELVSLAEEGQPLTVRESSEPEAFNRFFPLFIRELLPRGKKEETLSSIVDAIEQGRTLGPIRTSGHTGPQRDSGRDLVEAWRGLKSPSLNKQQCERETARLFERIGFSNCAAKVVQEHEQYWLVELDCQPIADQHTCIVPDFGSKAAGRYAVVVVRGRPAVDDLISLVRSVDPQLERPLIVLFLDRLSENMRRRLVESVWGSGKRPFLVADELLIVFLAAEASSRLPAFFRCSFPFASLQPYTTTATHVPVELFFGRHHEYDEVYRTSGTCLVYGGRQLGKSVLLREVARRQHQPERGIIVIWIDLKHRGIGIDKPPTQLWATIGEALHAQKVLEFFAPSSTTIRKRVREWLQANSERRILLLLDEADGFFEQDSRAMGGHSFAVLAELKGLMDETERRFKVVFAGLHNVQRAARDPNTPVAHLGAPVNIGPLLDRGQWKKAKALVEQPLFDLGFRFEEPSLSMRILSHTNFYPSLIQVFCKHLLQYLHNHHRPTGNEHPPHIITSDLIERVYLSKELQKEIRDRFELTLNLDTRYRLLALLIAWKTLDARKAGELANGFSVAQLREEALDFWAIGFANDTSFERFRILLEEMVGLGVLRHTTGGQFALRSINVLNLLGTDKQIEEMLQDVTTWLPGAPYEASSYRRALGDGPCPRRSPLTAEQEGQLAKRSNGVTLIVGSQLGQIAEVPASLKHSDLDSDVIANICPDLGTADEFQAWLSKIEIDRKKEDCVMLVVVPTSMPWKMKWIEIANAFLKRKKSATRRFLRIAFTCDPQRLWNEIPIPQSCDELEILQVRPWNDSMLLRWLDDNNLHLDAAGEKLKELQSATGGWGLLLERFSKRFRQHHIPSWEEELKSERAKWFGEYSASLFELTQIPIELVPMLNLLADDPLDQLTLSELLPETPVVRGLEWAEAVSYVAREQEGLYRIDSVLRAILRAGVVK